MIKYSYNILIVEDEWINAEFISQLLLSLSQNVVSVVHNAKDALKVIESETLDFIFMDINIDGPIDGVQLAQDIKEIYPIPIIFMTAFGDSQTISEASDTNIYGFIIKPFNAQDVEAALHVAIQRSSVQEEEKTALIKSTMQLGYNYVYDPEKALLTYNNSHIALTKKESKLLEILCLNHNSLVSTDAIYAYVWEEKTITDSTIRDTIVRLRKKIIPLELKNVVGMGYILQKV